MKEHTSMTVKPTYDEDQLRELIADSAHVTGTVHVGAGYEDLSVQRVQSVAAAVPILVSEYSDMWLDLQAARSAEEESRTRLERLQLVSRNRAYRIGQLRAALADIACDSHTISTVQHIAQTALDNDTPHAAPTAPPDEQTPVVSLPLRPRWQPGFDALWIAVKETLDDTTAKVIWMKAQEIQNESEYPHSDGYGNRYRRAPNGEVEWAPGWKTPDSEHFQPDRIK